MSKEMKVSKDIQDLFERLRCLKYALAELSITYGKLSKEAFEGVKRKYKLKDEDVLRYNHEKKRLILRLDKPQHQKK